MIFRMFGMLFALGLFSYFPVSRMLGKGEMKEAAAYIGLTALAAAFMMAVIAGADIPGLILPYKVVFQPIGEMFLK